MRNNMVFTILVYLINPLNILQSNPIDDFKWFDDQFIYSIVLFEKETNDSLLPFGTGFLIHNYEKEDNPFVVTCAHILNRECIYLVVVPDSDLLTITRLSETSGIQMGESSWKFKDSKLMLRVELRKNDTYVIHPDTSIDIGVFPVELFAAYMKGKIQLKVTKTKTISRSFVKSRSDVNLGDNVYFVGFPFGIGTEHTLNPLVRSGSVAWMSDDENEFLLDAFSYGGNSGSPVFTRIKPTEDRSCLIGMVIGHLGPEFENFGLARCVWVDDILTVIELAKNLKLK
jgi:hypothetical protein